MLQVLVHSLQTMGRVVICQSCYIYKIFRGPILSSTRIKADDNDKKKFEIKFVVLDKLFRDHNRHINRGTHGRTLIKAIDVLFQ